METFETREAWLAARRLGIGGSDVPAILGISPWKTPLQVWASKLGLADDDETSYTMRRGSHMEPLLWRELESEVPGLMSFPLSRTIVTGPEPWMLYSPDAFLFRVDDQTAALGEGKSHPRGSADWDDGVPAHVVAQVQWGMHVCDLGVSYVAVDLGTEFKWARVARDPAWWPKHRDALIDFWCRVVDREAPAATGAEGDRRALGAMYRSHTGEARSLDPAFLEVAHEYDETVAAIKVLEQKKDDIVNRVCEAIGEAERGVLPDGSGWSWKKQSKPKMVADPTQPRHEFRVVRRFGASKED